MHTCVSDNCTQDAVLDGEHVLVDESSTFLGHICEDCYSDACYYSSDVYASERLAYDA